MYVFFSRRDHENLLSSSQAIHIDLQESIASAGSITCENQRTVKAYICFALCYAFSCNAIVNMS